YGRAPDVVIASGWLYLTWLAPTVLAVVLWRNREKRPLLLLAAGIFVAGMLPVSGIVPFRFQNSSTVADRYLYFSFAGAALGTASILDRWHSRIRIPAVALMLGFCALVSAFQVRHWRNDAAVFTHILDVNPRSWAAHYGLGRALVRAENEPEALRHFREAVRLQPEFTKGHF